MSFKQFSESLGSPIRPVDKFISSCLMSVTYMHSAHFQTGSYAKHKAFQTFYEDMQDKIDEFVEVYIGTGMEYRPAFSEALQYDVDAIGYLQSIIQQANAIDIQESCLLNIRDEIKAICFQTIYKLTHLS